MRAPPPAARLALVAAAYAALLLALFHQVWWGGEAGVRVFGWDCLREYWPDLVFQIRALADGELPLWNPTSLGGYPFVGDPQTGLWSPVNWLLWLASWLVGSVGPWLIVVKVLLLLELGLVGTHILVRRRTGSELAASVAALIFVIGSPSLVHKNSSLLWPVLVLPWIVLALDAALDRPCWRRGVAVGAALWLAGSAGSAQGFFYALLVVGPYGLFRLLEERAAPLRPRLVAAAAAAVSAALLLGATYLPAAAVVEHTPRASRGLAYVLQQPLTWSQLGELVLPARDTSWMADFYLGALALVAATAALATARPGRERRERIFWIALTAFALLCALGPHGGLLGPLATWAPGFGLFRIAYRYKLIVGFTVALLAGDGVAALLRGVDRRARLAVAATALLWLLAAAALATGHPARDVVPALFLGGGAVLLLAVAAHVPRRAGALVAAAVALTLADLWSAGASKIDILQSPPRLEADAALAAQLDGAADRWRYLRTADRGGDHTSAVMGIRDLGGYPNPFILRRMNDVIERARRSPALAARFNVRYRVGAAPRSPAAGGGVVVVPDAAPLARLYPAVELLPAPAILARLADPAPLVAALVDPADAPPALPRGSGEPRDATLVAFARNRIELAVSAKAAGVLVVNEAHFPGWEAEVDGAPTPIFRAAYALRGLAVPAGDHRVVLRFRPPGLRLGAAGFALGVLLVLAAAVPLDRLRRRRFSPPSADRRARRRRRARGGPRPPARSDCG